MINAAASHAPVGGPEKDKHHHYHVSLGHHIHYLSVLTKAQSSPLVLQPLKIL
jgi:hypothetical protein